MADGSGFAASATLTTNEQIRYLLPVENLKEITY